MEKIVYIRNCIKTPSAITQEDGNFIYKIIVDALENNYNIILDFSGVEHIIPAFLNNAIGKLYEKYSSRKIKKYVSIINVSEEMIPTFNAVIENAKRYYSGRAVHKNAMDLGVSLALDSVLNIVYNIFG